MNKYKVITFVICLVLLVLYSCSIYQVNKNAPNLRNYTMETLGKEFSAFGGKITVKKDRKSTRLNSSHANISYAVFCLKKKKKNKIICYRRTAHYEAQES